MCINQMDILFNKDVNFLINALVPPLERGMLPPVSSDKDAFVGENTQYLLQRLDHALSDVEQTYGKMDLALTLMRYVSGELVYGLRCGFATGAAVFMASPGVTCAAYAKALVALARAGGIPAREAALHNMPDFTGHTICELWVENRWICVDPRYGLLFSSQKKWDPEALLSFDQLVCQRVAHWYPLKILRIPGKGRDKKTASGLPELVDPTEPDEHFYTNTLLNSYRNMIATAYPVTYRATATCFPLLADLRKSASCELFALHAQTPNNTPSNARILGIGKDNGSRSLGYAFMNMLWLKSREQSLIRITITFTAPSPPLQCLPLAHLRVISKTQPTDRRVCFTVRVTAPESMALLYSPHEFGVLEHVEIALVGEGEEM